MYVSQFYTNLGTEPAYVFHCTWDDNLTSVPANGRLEASCTQASAFGFAGGGLGIALRQRR